MQQSLEHDRLDFPFLLVLLYLFIEYGRPQDWLPALEVLHPGALVLGAGIVALLIKRPTSLPKVGVYIIVWIGLMAIGIPFAYNNYAAFVTTQDFALFVFGAVLPIMVFLDSFRKLVIVLRAWIFMHVPLALYGILHQGVGIGSFLGDENDFCLAINVVLPYAFWYLLVTPSWTEKFVLSASIIVFLSAITSSMSRGGFLGLLALGGFYWLRSSRKLLGIVMVVALVGLLWIIAPSSYWDEMRTIETSQEESDTGYARLYLWRMAWEMFLHNPILGVGPKNYGYMNQFYEIDYEKGKGVHFWGAVSHSLYFTILPEEGLVGVILFLLIVVHAWKDRAQIRRSYRLRDRKAESSDLEQLTNMYYLGITMDASLITYLVTSAFITTLYYPHFWILTGFSAALKLVYDSRTKELAVDRVKPGWTAPTARIA